jgi:hypothetical protein
MLSRAPLPLPSQPQSWRVRATAAAIHLALSVFVACLTALLVFLVWYPMPFREISGGRELFLIVVAVDVVLGPVITFAIFDRRKHASELRRDLAFVVLLQVAALAYGLFTVYQVRPAVVALEVDRLRVVRAIDLEDADLSRAPEGLRALSRTGPLFIATRPPKADEKLEAIDRGLAGEDIGMRPDFWLPPADTAAAFANAARPLAELQKRASGGTQRLNHAVEATGRPTDQLGYLPILARSTNWSALVDLKNGSVVGYVAIDGF